MTPNQLLAPSASFKKEAAKSIVAILFFMVVYLLMVAASVALLVGAFYAGLAIIMLKPGFYTLLAGLGIMGAGVMIVVFLIKFLFSAQKQEATDIEITEEDQPKLIALIYEIAQQTGTQRPKKVFLSPDVNACVFYNSSFWSMFLPVRKNLKIGLGLVNALNASEFKAVIAHEFGHFSQRSMKVGSWVYQVNKIIHDMLFNNRGYTESLSAIGSIHGILALFAHITVAVVRVIQWVLQQVFKIVNKSYLGLSRQMEFHADLIASSIYGSNNIVNALHRIDFADSCYQSTLQICNTALKQKKAFTDIYTNHAKMQVREAAQRGFVVGEGQMSLSQNTNAVNRVNVKNQWASHPTHAEREAYLLPFNLKAAVDTAPAWVYFTDAQKWKQRLTEYVYESVSAEEKQTKIGEKEFEEMLAHQMRKFSFPTLFGAYYDAREIKLFDVEGVVATPYTIHPLQDWFSEPQMALPKKLQTLEQDIAVVKAVSGKEIAANSFDFDGKKYKREKAVEIAALLEAEKEGLQRQLEELDQQLFRHAYALAPLAKAEELKQAYAAYFDLRKSGDAFLTTANTIMELLSPIFRGETRQVAAISLVINDLKARHEPDFKTALQWWESNGVFAEDTELQKKMTAYCAANWVYFHNENFIEPELIGLTSIVQESWACIINHIFSVFVQMVERQAVYLQGKTEEVISEQ